MTGPFIPRRAVYFHAQNGYPDGGGNGWGGAASDHAAVREHMVKDQVERRGVHDARVLEAMRRLPRHLFVDPSLGCRAYEDSGIVGRLAQLVLKQGLPRDTLLNVNVPAGEVKGMAVTRQGKRSYSELIVEKIDPRGKTYYWIGGGEPTWELLGGTDYEAVMEGKISITPLHLDLTNYGAIEGLKKWEALLT